MEWDGGPGADSILNEEGWRTGSVADGWRWGRGRWARDVKQWVRGVMRFRTHIACWNGDEHDDLRREALDDGRS